LIRNLIYYICPIKSNKEWIDNVGMLSKYSDCFNGKKIVAIASEDSSLEEYSKVKAMVMEEIGADTSIFACENVRGLGEIVPFAKMLKIVKSEREDEITFYAHAKGVSPRYSHEKNKKQLRNKRAWRNLMYHFNLHDMYAVESVMRDHVSCGCVKRNTHMLGGSKAKWHYAGNFFWFKHKPVFSNKDWDKIRMIRVGVEAYLGENFEKESGYCLFGEDMPFAIVSFSENKWVEYLSQYELTLEDVVKGKL